jgi:hypothetical protein
MEAHPCAEALNIKSIHFDLLGLLDLACASSLPPSVKKMSEHWLL